MKMKWTLALLAMLLITTSVQARFSTESRPQRPAWPDACFLAGHQRPDRVLVNGYCYYRPSCREGYQFVEQLGRCVRNSDA